MHILGLRNIKPQEGPQTDDTAVCATAVSATSQDSNCGGGSPQLRIVLTLTHHRRSETFAQGQGERRDGRGEQGIAGSGIEAGAGYLAADIFPNRVRDG